MSTFTLNPTTPAGAIAGVLQHFGVGHVALASSFGAEDQVLTDMLVKINPAARVFTLDTGRQFEETYDTMQRSVDKYGVRYEVYAPDAGEIATLVSLRGPNLFYNSIAERKECCRIRKINPLNKALATVRVWICGLRRDQAVTRQTVELISFDPEHNIYKVCPLYDWSEQQVWEYIREHDVPYNKLHDQGFPSIGCAPCTRAVAPGEDVRAGRWWWESPEHKECGLHRPSSRGAAGRG